MDKAKYNPQTHQLDIPLQDHKTLIRRTNDFTANMKAFRNKLNPKSKDLSLCKSIVADLEKIFDDYPNTCSKIFIGSTFILELPPFLKKSIPKLSYCFLFSVSEQFVVNSHFVQ